MKKASGFLLGLIVAVWGSIVAVRIGPHVGDVFIRWAAVYIILHAICLLIYSDPGKRLARKIREQYKMNIQMSYVAVPALFALVGLIVWWGINKTFDEYFPLQSSTTPSPTPTPVSRLETSSAATATPTPQAKVSRSATPAATPTASMSAADVAKEVAKLISTNQPQLQIIKGKAIDLADEIAQFDKRRKSLVATAQIPSGNPSQTGQDIQNQINSLRQNSPGFFNAKFSKRLQESISELKGAGIYTGDVEQTCEHVMYMTMADCGDELRKAANKIPASMSSFDSLPVKKLSFIQEPTNSTRDDAPYAVKVVIQTNVKIQPVSIVVRCDSEAADGNVRMAGASVFLTSGWGYQRDDKRNFWLFFNNEFNPETPITAIIMSAHPIKVLAVTEGPSH